MTLEQKMMERIGQWYGTDAAERTSNQGQLIAELIQLVSESVPTKTQAPTPFCAFCATRYMDNLFAPRKRSAA